jgi:hypothetical protein
MVNNEASGARAFGGRPLTRGDAFFGTTAPAQSKPKCLTLSVDERVSLCSLDVLVSETRNLHWLADAF